MTGREGRGKEGGVTWLVAAAASVEALELLNKT